MSHHSPIGPDTGFHAGTDLALGEDLGLRRLTTEPRGSEHSLERIERNIMERIERPVSRLRALALATPARVAGTFLLGGLALGAGAVAALDQLGVSVVHSDGDEYVQVDTPNPGERVLLPVAPGEGEALVDLIEGGSALLTLEGSGATEAGAVEASAGELATPRAPHDFKVGPDGLVPEGSGASDGGMLIRSPDGRERRVRALEPRER